MMESELKLFLDISLNFFEKMTGQKPELKTPSISLGFSKFHQCHGWISVSGMADGVVCVSMTTDMVNELLRSQGETIESESMQQDLVGEAASIIASNARRHFGPKFQISPPQTSMQDESIDRSWPYSRFCLPVQWRGHDGVVILAFEDKAPVEV